MKIILLLISFLCWLAVLLRQQSRLHKALEEDFKKYAKEFKQLKKE